MGIFAGVVGVVLCFASMPWDLDLPNVHPDETAEETYERRFSFENAIESLNRIRLAGDGPQAMTAEERTIGYPNWVGAVEGTLRKQQLIISKLTYELAVARHGMGEISTEDLEEARNDFEEQKRSFVKFWEQFGVAD